LLGDDRFTRLWAAQDPLFSVIQRVARDQGLSDERTLSVYEVFNDSQDAFAEAARRFDFEPELAANGLRAIQTNMEQRLAGLVGEEVAQVFIRAQSQVSITSRGM